MFLPLASHHRVVWKWKVATWATKFGSSLSQTISSIHLLSQNSNRLSTDFEISEIMGLAAKKS